MSASTTIASDESVGQGMATNHPAAIIHVATEADFHARGSKCGRPNEPGGRCLKDITHPEMMEKNIPTPHTSSNV